MTRRFSLLRCRRYMVAVIVLFVVSCPASACDPDSQNLFDWNHCWSLSRFVLAGLAFLPCWLIWFEFVFRQRLQGRSLDAPSPRSVFASSLAWCWLSFWAIFLILFAGVSDELRSIHLNLSGWPFLNSNWPWILGSVALIPSSLFIHWLFNSQRQRSEDRTAK
jgi:hypothetical protein